MKKSITFVDEAKKVATIDIEIKLPRIGHYTYAHKGDTKKTYKDFNQRQYPPEFTASGYYGNGGGQCLDHIVPTKKQKLLVNFWKLHHLHRIYPEQEKLLDKIIYDIEQEEKNRREALFQQTEWDVDDPAHEDIIINWILDNTDAEDRDEAYKYLALAQECNLEVVEIADIHQAEYDEHIYQVQGIDYYAGTDDELEELAKERLTDDDSLWIEAVKAHATTDSLEDWAQNILDMDGPVSVLNTYDGCSNEHNFVEYNQPSIIVCRA